MSFQPVQGISKPTCPALLFDTIEQGNEFADGGLQRLQPSFKLLAGHSDIIAEPIRSPSAVTTPDRS